MNIGAFGKDHLGIGRAAQGQLKPAVGAGKGQFFGFLRADFKGVDVLRGWLVPL